MLARVQKLVVRHFQVELVQQLYVQMRGYHPIGAFAALVVVLLYGELRQDAALIAWLAAVLALLAAMAAWCWWQGRTLPAAHAPAWLAVYIALYAALSLAWGVGALLVFPGTTLWQQIAFTFLLFAVVTTPMSALTGNLPLFVAAALLTLVPLLVAMQLYEASSAVANSLFLLVLAGLIAVLHVGTLNARRLLQAAKQGAELGRARAEATGARQRLQWLEERDSLTGLPSFAALRERIDREHVRRRRPFAVLVVNIDDFRELNVSHGWAAGDEALRVIAARLRNLGRDDLQVARHMNDEFLLLYEGEVRDQVLDELAALVHAVFAQPVRTRSVNVQLSAAIGAAVHPDHGESAMALVENALVAMRQCKEAPEERFCIYDERHRASVRARASMRTELARALERGELEVHLQPKVELRGGRVCGAEALLRWQSAAYGPVSPAEFIPIAEASGSIVPISRWLTDEVVQLLQSPSLPRGFSIAMNVSVKQFASADFSDSLIRAARTLEGVGRQLEMEITESVVMTDFDAVAAILRELSDAGIRSALDDFGTGYSSLGYLSRLPIHAVKLDPSFIRPVPGDERQSSLVASVAQMVHVLELDLVAEGVETAEQRDWLRLQGCGVAQGYFFSRPLPARRFLEDLPALQRRTRDAPARP